MSRICNRIECASSRAAFASFSASSRALDTTLNFSLASSSWLSTLRRVVRESIICCPKSRFACRANLRCRLASIFASSMSFSALASFFSKKSTLLIMFFIGSFDTSTGSSIFLFSMTEANRSSFCASFLSVASWASNFSPSAKNAAEAAAASSLASSSAFLSNSSFVGSLSGGFATSTSSFPELAFRRSFCLSSMCFKTCM
mmetsp:Transcript_4475/g.8732  ORF Transcript_4475/g.8732 Transcript_4475/m.8732 type:complete len:201 (+) Transcript_4475:2396-2998(+)